MYRVVTSIFISSTVIVGCAGFKSAPQYGAVHKITHSTDASCDETSNLTKVRDCVLALKNAYGDRTVALDASRTTSGGLLIATAAAAAGGELFKRSRDITRTSGLLGGVISSANSLAPPAALANVLQNGRSQLECALVKSDQLYAELKIAEAKFQQMDATYEQAEDAVETAELDPSTSKQSANNMALLSQALESMERVCNNTKAAELMQTPAAKRVMNEQEIARKLYETAVSISDNVVGKYRGSYTQPVDAVKQIDTAVAKVKEALAQAQAMKEAAKLVADVAAAAAPAVDCKNVDPAKKPEAAACAATQNAKVVNDAASDIANIALTAASLSACAGVQ